MDLKNNIDEQRKYLTDNLENINIVASAVLGTKTSLQIEEKTNRQKETYFSLLDSTNRRVECGIMKSAFKSVHIESFGVWWDENIVIINLNFQYELINGGRNGASFCTIKVENGLVSVLDQNAD